MKFCDKLPKQRKNCNLSQEQLADRLGISRQAVSKWESGLSYPDMEKLMQLCKILNCTLDELLDDGVISEEHSNKTTPNKFSFDNCLKDLLTFVTRTYNMICQMTWKQRFLCFFEMAFIAFALFIVGIFFYYFAYYFTTRILQFIPFQRILSQVFSMVYSFALWILGIIIFLHLFKIRYLDYYVTVEDQNVQEQTIEKPVEKQNTDTANQNPQKEKIIIRDPAHTPFRFFHLLGKLILLSIKIFTVFCAVPVVCLFLFFIFAMAVSLFHLPYGILFFWIALGLSGGAFLCYVLLELFYRFIFQVPQAFKKLFIFFLIGLALIGTGTGFAFSTCLNYDVVHEIAEEDYQVDVQTIPMTEDLNFYLSCPYEFVIDEEEVDVRLEIQYLPSIAYQLEESPVSSHTYLLRENSSFSDFYQFLMADLKEKRIHDYSSLSFLRVRIVSSSENLAILKNNFFLRMD